MEGSAPQAGHAVGILGAGILGCCLALDLARRGVQVDLYDQHPEPMRGASLHGEGKLHLGFIYANDPTRQTHEVMIAGSMCFGSILSRLTGADMSRFRRSGRFIYAVPADSLVGADALETHYERVGAALRAHVRDVGGDYLGQDMGPTFRRLGADEVNRHFAPGSVTAAFDTAEQAVSTPAVAAIVRAAVAQAPGIRFHPATEVLSATVAGSDGVELALRAVDGPRRVRHPIVVNGLWDGRLAIDETAGLPRPVRPWLHRYKATLRIQSPSASALPSVTLTLGPYGDLVNFGDGEYYVSWYPEFRLGQSAELDGRPLHALRQDKDAAELAQAGIRAMSRFMPGIQQVAAEPSLHEVGGGVIFAWGQTDVDEPRSELHQRHAIGPQRHGPYISIDTGKYCLGPWLAARAAEAVCEQLDLGRQGQGGSSV